MKTLQVKLPGRSYNIDIGLNILQTQLPNVVLKKNTDLVVVVTNETLQNLYPDHVSSILEDSGIRVAACVLPDGEQYKNLDTFSQIFDFLMEASANRKTLLIAFCSRHTIHSNTDNFVGSSRQQCGRKNSS